MVGFFRLTVTSPSPLIGVRGGRWLSPSIETPPGARRSIVVNGLAAGVLGTEDCAGAPASPLDCRLPKATFVVESDTLRLTLDSLGVAFGSLGLSFVPRRKLLERDFISSGARLSPLVRSCSTLQTADTLPLWVWAFSLHLSGQCGLTKAHKVHWHSGCGPSAST